MLKKEHLLFPSMVRRLAKRLGAEVLIEPQWGVVGRITYKNGRRRYFRYNTLDLNPVGASDVAKDKDYANFFLADAGYPIVPGKAFFSPSFAKVLRSGRSTEAACRYAQKIGFPVIVKPNSGSQGQGVALAHTKHELLAALRTVFAQDRVALVQRPVTGTDVRIVVLDGTVISAYVRTPLTVVGDGTSTVAQLLKKKAREFLREGRDTRIDVEDPRIKRLLARGKRSMQTVLKRDERLPLLANANLSTGGDATDITSTIHADWKKIAVAITADMGLRLCGVDLMIDGDVTKQPAQYWVLEINAAPGLDHYAKRGKAQEKIVENLYTKVLKSLAA